MIEETDFYDIIVLGAGPTGICLTKVLTKLFPDMKIKVQHLFYDYLTLYN